MIIEPSGASTSMPIRWQRPWVRKSCIHPFLLHARKNHAQLISTSYFLKDTDQLFSAMEKRAAIPCDHFNHPLIISSAALKSAITPSRQRSYVLIFSCVLPCICLTVPHLLLSIYLYFYLLQLSTVHQHNFIIMYDYILAVPKFNAISCVKKENIPI